MAAPAPVPGEITFALPSPLQREDLPTLCARMAERVAPGPSRVVIDLGAAAPDAVTVDALAQLQLLAHRSGWELRLRGASPELRELVAFVGLDGVLRL